VSGSVLTPVRVGVFVVATAVAFAAFLQIVSTRGMDVRESYVVHAHFDDVLGLEKKSPVQIAGIDIGAIEAITLDEGRAKLTLRIRKDVQLYEDARLSKVAVSLLGDYKLAVNPGTATRPPILDGGWIRDVRSTSDTEQILGEVRRISESISKLVAGTPDKPAPLELIVRDVQGSAAAARQVIEAVAANIDENTRKLDAIVDNVEGFTGDLRTISRDKDAAFDQITADAQEIARSLRVTAGALEQLVAGQDRAEIKESVSSLRTTLDTMNRALERFASIAEKVDRGQGTVGALVNERGIHDKVEEATDGIADLVGSISGLQTWVNLRSEFQFRAGAAKNYVSIQLMPKEDKYYIIELVDDPRGVRDTVITDVTTTSPETGRDFQYRERRTTTTDSLKFSLMIGKRFDWFALRFGIIENTGGIGADLFFFRDRLRFLVDLNQFGDDTRLPRVKALTWFEVVPHVYLTGGVDDFLNPQTTDFFLGAGVRFNDEDLKALLFIAGAPSTQ
jgi:phospholipid/cholesterol/gamma-HCH transport system substrate-binding protein